MGLTPYVPIKKNEKKCYLTGWSTLSHAQLAEAMKTNNGGNVGLRLDQYMALDPDCPEAEKFCMELDADGELPTTITYKSASGYTVRLYNPPPGKHKPIHILNPFELEIRTGPGQLCVLDSCHYHNRIIVNIAAIMNIKGPPQRILGRFNSAEWV